MSLQMSSGSEKYHEGNTFNRDSSEATFFGGPVEVNKTVDDLFEEINRYCDQQQATHIDLFDEIDAYWEDDTSTVEPVDDELA